MTVSPLEGVLVVADTTPLNYLILIGEIKVLPQLYQLVLIPERVHAELLRPKTPALVREWALSLPMWCEVRAVWSTADFALNQLDPGERDAIQLALETGVNTLLMDDSDGRREASHRHMRVTGTVAVLEKAAQRGLTEFPCSVAAA